MISDLIGELENMFSKGIEEEDMNVKWKMYGGEEVHMIFDVRYEEDKKNALHRNQTDSFIQVWPFFYLSNGI